MRAYGNGFPATLSWWSWRRFKALRVVQLNYSDISSGAARAAHRIHHSVRAAGMDSTMMVNLSKLGDWTVEGPRTLLRKAITRLRPLGAIVIHALLRTENPINHSSAILPSSWPKRLNGSDVDVVHFHWVAGEMLSIRDIGRLKKPVVWTLHDMWAFCGAEHYAWDERWRQGYRSNNRPRHESGFDINRWTWERKYKHWQRPMHIVTPSSWLADCVRESALMCGWPVTVVPNPIDTDGWRPLDQPLARALLGLPSDVPLLLFGAMGGGAEYRKGFDLLLDSLAQLRGELKDFHLAVFGQLEPRQPPDLGFPIHYTGHLHDDLSLRALYSAADVLVIPSRQDNLPNTGVEAHACGTPVVAFKTGGLPDIVDHQRTGYLAHAFDNEDLAAGIRWVLLAGGGLRENARQRALERFAYPVVAEQYRKAYEGALTTS